VEHERVGIGSEFSHHERHALRHQSGNDTQFLMEAVGPGGELVFPCQTA
jgi:hypothetical protein